MAIGIQKLWVTRQGGRFLGGLGEEGDLIATPRITLLLGGVIYGSGKFHASQGLKVGLYTPTILGGNSYLSWFYDRGAITDRAHTGTSKGLSQAINRGPIRKFQRKYANVYVTIQSHHLSASHHLSTGVRSHYVTANGVRDGLSDLWAGEAWRRGWGVQPGSGIQTWTKGAIPHNRDSLMDVPHWV